MLRRARVWFRRLTATVLIGGAAAPAVCDDLESLEERLTTLHRDYASAVVRVKFATEDLDATGQPALGISSGFFIDREGRVLTTIHPSVRATRIWVEKDGIESLAELVGADPRTTIGLLQVVKLPERFGVIPVAEEADKRPIGSFVVAITNPQQLEPSPALGLVTGYESFFTKHQFPFSYLRVNIPVGMGEGGSPMLDLHGRLVGISVFLVQEVRSSYLVPTRALSRIVKQLSTHGRVVYGTVPLEFGEFPDSSNLVRQVVIQRVAPDSAAARAGIRAGDVVRRIGDTQVRRIHDVRDSLFATDVGQYIQLEVDRDGRTLPFALAVEAAPETNQPPVESGAVQRPLIPSPNRT
jgi:S1-C subfamily serine protease